MARYPKTLVPTGKFNEYSEKTAPVNADIVLIEDSAGGYGKKKVKVENLPTKFLLPFTGNPTGNDLESVLGWYEETDAAATIASGSPITPTIAGYHGHYVMNVTGGYVSPFTTRVIGVSIDETTGEPTPDVPVSGTTDGTTANKLVDSGATFQSDGVAAGMYVYNSTDDTWAEITAVDDEQTLSLDADIMVSGENYIVGVIEDISVNAAGYYQTSKSFVDAPTIVPIEGGINVTAQIIRTSYWDYFNRDFDVDAIRAEWEPDGINWDFELYVYKVNNDGSATRLDNNEFDFNNGDALPRAANGVRGKHKRSGIASSVLGSQKEGIVIAVYTDTILDWFIGVEIDRG